MKLPSQLLIIVCLVCAPYAVAQAQVVPHILPSIDGLPQALQLPELGEQLTRNIANNRLLNQTISPLTSAVPELLGGLPGIDGLNLSSTALQPVFQGLAPAAVRALFANADPRVQTQIINSISGQLPGLGGAESQPLQTLPGLDGLPVKLSD